MFQFRQFGPAAYLHILKAVKLNIFQPSFLISAFGYGGIAIGFAFMVGNIGGILQATISVTGSVSGPLLGAFMLGVLFKFTNKWVS